MGNKCCGQDDKRYEPKQIPSLRCGMTNKKLWNDKQKSSGQGKVVAVCGLERIDDAGGENGQAE